ncbi:CIC11C00000003341 [Sungouiella intermedia]|uniref:candidapepsin n=1 Tax=Sungouiella intermedia TaxID=45354 RepID=A0A1L0BDR7_9ASCO|nr:CIC11C00000003341 [[Candida] intermedia]
MKLILLAIVTLLPLALSSAALKASNGCMKIDFDIEYSKRNLSTTKLLGRDGNYGLLEVYEQAYYNCDLQVGSNKQHITVCLDTGSSDFWSNLAKKDQVSGSSSTHSVVSSYQAKDQGNTYFGEASPTSWYGPLETWCTTLGSFATDESTSFHNNNTYPFYIEYIMGNFAYGTWGTDTVEIMGFTVPDVSVAVVNSTNSIQGVLGIGLSSLEFTYRDSGYQYANLPMRLKAEGITKKNMYSLFLNEVGAKGTVLFGAVDHAKYIGTLQTLPLINLYPQIYEHPSMFMVLLSSITLEGASFNQTITSVTIPALLDSGSPVSSFTRPLFNRFQQTFSAEDMGTWYKVDCNYNTESMNLFFDISGIQIKVPMSEFIVRWNGVCYLNIEEVPDPIGDEVPFIILGDNFLRSAYVVYDLDDYEVLIAQVKHSDDEDIEVVTLTIPLAVRAPSYSELTYDTAATDSGTVSVAPLSVAATASSSQTDHISNGISQTDVYSEWNLESDDYSEVSLETGYNWTLMTEDSNWTDFYNSDFEYSTEDWESLFSYTPFSYSTILYSLSLFPTFPTSMNTGTTTDAPKPHRNSAMKSLRFEYSLALILGLLVFTFVEFV